MSVEVPASVGTRSLLEANGRTIYLENLGTKRDVGYIRLHDSCDSEFGERGIVVNGIEGTTYVRPRAPAVVYRFWEGIECFEIAEFREQHEDERPEFRALLNSLQRRAKAATPAGFRNQHPR